MPARRDAGSADHAGGAGALRRGRLRALPRRGGLRTGPSDIAALDHQTIRPYTDLLLHDLGPTSRRHRTRCDPTRSGARHPSGASGSSRRSTTTLASSTTGGPATSRRRSSGTAARRRTAQQRFRDLDAGSATQLTGVPELAVTRVVLVVAVTALLVAAGLLGRRLTRTTRRRRPPPAGRDRVRGADRSWPTRSWCPPTPSWLRRPPAQAQAIDAAVRVDRSTAALDAARQAWLRVNDAWAATAASPRFGPVADLTAREQHRLPDRGGQGRRPGDGTDTDRRHPPSPRRAPTCEGPERVEWLLFGRPTSANDAAPLRLPAGVRCGVDRGRAAGARRLDRVRTARMYAYRPGQLAAVVNGAIFS